MTIKPIIDVEIPTRDMQRFTELYDRFQQQLAKTPAAWKQVSKEHAAIAAQMERMTASIVDQNHLAREQQDDDEKRLKGLEKTQRLWMSISHSSTSLYRNVIGIGESVLKWGGLFGGIATGLTAGSVFGYDKLADNVSGERAKAQGLGISIGQQKAFGLNFGRYVDTGSLLQSVLQMENDPSKRNAWVELMHGRKMSGNTADDALAFLQAERQFAIQHKGPNLGLLAESYQLPSSINDLMRLSQTGTAARAAEFNRQIQHYQRDSVALNISDRSASGAQDFKAQMERNFGSMSVALWNSLSRLNGPLSQLSSGLTHAAVAVLGSPAAKSGIEAVANWLKTFNGTLKGDDFSKKLREFTSSTGIVADGVHVLAEAFKPLITAASGWEKLYQFAAVSGDKVHQFATASNDLAWRFGNFISGKGGMGGPDGLVDHSAGELADWYQRTGVSAAALRGADMAGVAARPIAARAPTIHAPALAAPGSIKIEVNNATGGSAVVSINGMVGS